MHRGNRRQPIFSTDIDRFDFLDLLGELPDRTGIEIHAFALMGNHYHLLMRCPDGGLSAALHRLNASYARRFNHRHGLDGHLFQGRFRSLTVGGLDYLLEVLRYIHRNPVIAGLCRRAIDYEWSSHAAYAGNRRPEWLTTTALLDYFDGDTTRLVGFVDSADTAAARRVADAIDKQAPAIGATDFVAGLLDGALIDDETVSSARRLAPPCRTADQIAALARSLGLPFAELMTTGDPRHPHFGLVLAALHHEAGCTHAELAELFGYANRSSVATRIKRFEAGARDDPEATALYGRAADALRLTATRAA